MWLHKAQCIFLTCNEAICSISISYAGAETEPEILQHVFRSLGVIIQHLAKLISPDLPQFLRHSSRLRYHVAPHVRQLASATLAYLLRHATTLQLRAAVRTVFAGNLSSPWKKKWLLTLLGFHLSQ